MLQQADPLRWPKGRLQLAHAPIANSDTTPCQCGTQKPLGGWRSGLQFLAQMVQSVPTLYAADKVDWLSSHSYPYSGEPFGTARATSGLTYYRNETALVGRPSLPVILTERQEIVPLEHAVACPLNHKDYHNQQCQDRPQVVSLF